MKYKRKVPTVEAFQLNRDAEINAPGWFARAVKKEMIYFDRCITDGAIFIYGCTINTGCGKLKAKVGDYIVKESSGEIRSYKSKDFARIFERMQEHGTQIYSTWGTKRKRQAKIY